jgi:hypothetical protein
VHRQGAEDGAKNQVPAAPRHHSNYSLEIGRGQHGAASGPRSNREAFPGRGREMGGSLRFHTITCQTDGEGPRDLLMLPFLNDTFVACFAAST